jgi:hypothetical protein
MLINPLKIIEIFCERDDFVQSVERFLQGRLVGSRSPHAVNEPTISLQEMICIEVLYHLSGYKCFQYYYQQAVQQGALRSYFPSAASYNKIKKKEKGFKLINIKKLYSRRVWGKFK